jgi:hypothetical protein
MKADEILKAIYRMAEDDNKGIMMTTTILNACINDDISEVTFQVSEAVASSAKLQSLGIAGEHMCCAFFINRKELKKYKN